VRKSRISVAEPCPPGTEFLDAETGAAEIAARDNGRPQRPKGAGTDSGNPGTNSLLEPDRKIRGSAGLGGGHGRDRTCDPLMSQRLYPNGDRGLSERGPLKWDRTGFDAGDTVVGAQDVALRYSAEAVTFHSNGTTHLEPIQRAKTRLLATGGTALVSEFQGHQFGSPVANAMGDIISGDIEDAAFLQDTANDDVGMGMASVVMIDRNPVEARIEILLYLSHEVAGKTSQIGHLIGVIGRDDKTELMPIVPTPFDEGLTVSLVLNS